MLETQDLGALRSQSLSFIVGAINTKTTSSLVVDCGVQGRQQQQQQL